MDINRTMMMFFQAAQSNNAASLAGMKADKKDSFESLLSQKANQKDTPSETEQTSKKPEDLNGNDMDKKPITDQTDKESLSTEDTQNEVLVQEVFGNSELLAALLLNHNDLTAAVQSLQEMPTEVGTEAVAVTQVQAAVAESSVPVQRGNVVQTADITAKQPVETLIPKGTETAKTQDTKAVDVQSQTVQSKEAAKDVIPTIQVEHTVMQKKNVEPSKQVVVQDAMKQGQDEVPEDMVIQTKTLTPVEEMHYVKVADVVSVEKGNVAEQLTDQILMKKENVFELQLDPAHLGKIQVKVSFENGETSVSILCASQKAMEALSDHKGSLIGLLESRMGQTANVQIQTQKEEQDLLFQHDQQNNNKQGQKQQEEQQHKKQQDEDTSNFLQQLRLGLV